ncbi:GGDEF domain-containing protein [Kaistia sp. 32K]|uniref:GGDEF domain-containing protein n=1 Tax=Kaistia sp. 32K TaxID=2795690 RepID=UPI001916157E|nr:GGDEF domain-containing protein [Kaistia sp. 32K]BCP52816.1 GGDEF domain-containing protein [Kaistia sp. 32K]
MLDFASLLVAIGFATAFLSVILFAAWKTSRGDGFLLTCAIGAVMIAVSVGFSTLDSFHPSNWVLGIAFALLLGGIANLYGSATQFRLGGSPWRRIATASLVTAIPMLLPLLSGYNGITYAVGFTGSAALLLMTSYQFWRAREQAPMTTLGIASLYLLVGLSFLPRAVLVLVRDGIVVTGPPRNWAQDLSVMLVIGAIPALGAMTMALSQIRTAQAHRREALTDPLTGLMNRRALFETHAGEMKPTDVTLLFDIDEFKSINDTHGHAMGDRVISLFAEALKANLPASASAARIGGEEFAVILQDATLDRAMRHAEAVRARFIALVEAETRLTCTASAGLAAGGPQAANIDRVLAEADRALYEAKRGGRNRIIAARQPAREILPDDAASSPANPEPVPSA